jgi:NitT/TauT family transport system permease protein
LITGRGEPLVWPYLFATLEATAFGFLIGIVGGALMGLILSHDRRVRQVLSPYISAVNSTPKIAIIPIIIIIFGSTINSSVAVSAMLVFFAVFFNAYAGGRGVPVEMLQNVRLMGASGADVMLWVRSMYVILWTFEALPNAISHGLLGVVTAEFLSGVRGIGSLIVQALVQVDATLTFALVVFLSVVGVVLVGATDFLRRRILHWWPGSN